MLKFSRQALPRLFHLSLRSATLILRFVLTFYIVRALGYEASGIYGLALGAIGILPAAVGLGLNYFSARDVIGMEFRDAAALIRTRLIVTTLSLLVCTVAGLGVFSYLGMEWSYLYALIIVLIWFETYSLDMHMPLLALDMGREANILVFIRSAAWVPFWIASVWLFPQFKTLAAVFLFWIASHLIALVVLAHYVRGWNVEGILGLPVRIDWLKDRLRRSWYIYVSDLSNVGMLYADRYVVSYFLGIEITGLYTFYWSLTNALQTLVTTAIVQVLFPKIYKTYDHLRVGAFTATLRSETTKVFMLSIAMGIALLVCGAVAVRFLPGHESGGYFAVFFLLTVAAVIRTTSEMLNIGLTTLKLDRHYAALNVFGVVLAMVLSVLFIWTSGFIGVGIAAVATATALMLARLSLLLVSLKRGHTPKAS